MTNETAPLDEIKTNGHTNGPTTNTRRSGDVAVAKKTVSLKTWLIGAGFVLAVALACIPWIRSSMAHESTDNAFIDADVSNVSARVSGQVTKVLVNDNQEVHANDLLVEIDSPDYQIKRDQARAQLASAETTARRTSRDLERYRQLRHSDSITQQQMDQYQADAEAAQAAVQLQRAALNQADLDLAHTEVRAPTSGRVTHKSVAIGDYAKMGQALLAIVPDDVWVTANFKETQLDHMHPGQRVEIKVDAYPGETFFGHVDSVQSGTGAQFSLLPPENATGNYVKVVQRVPVKIVLDSVDGVHRLVPGMSVVPSVTVR